MRPYHIIKHSLLPPFLALATLPCAHGATLSANYLDSAGKGFNDPILGADRRNAFEYALGLWSAVLDDAYAGETVVVDAQFNPLGGTSNSATLGSAGPRGVGFLPSGTSNPTGNNNVFFHGGLRNHLSGGDQSEGSEISARFNSDVDGSVVLGSTIFYYGTDNMAPSGTTDFVSTVLHEIGHGLGWSGSIDLAVNGNDGTNGQAIDQFTDVNQGDYINGSLINSYDNFVERTSDGSPLSTLSTADRLAAIQGDDISWAGALGIAANGGTAPDLFGPSLIQAGSSYSHLDEGDFPLELLSPQATPGTGHTLSPLTLAILEDQGWSITAVPEPGSALLLLLSGLFLNRRNR